MKDALGHEIIPSQSSLSIHTNRHRDTNGYSFGWIDGCTTNIIWANDTAFNERVAREFVKEYNATHGLSSRAALARAKGEE